MAIKAKSKAMLQSPINICEMDAYYQKKQRFDKKEKSFKPSKKELKVKPFKNQPTLLKTGT